MRTSGKVTSESLPSSWYGVNATFGSFFQFCSTQERILFKRTHCFADVFGDRKKQGWSDNAGGTVEQDDPRRGPKRRRKISDSTVNAGLPQFTDNLQVNEISTFAWLRN
jgi:hypothetical protein